MTWCGSGSRRRRPPRLWTSFPEKASSPAASPAGTSRRPTLTTPAGEGPNLGACVPIDHEVVAAGYDHLDVLTAAPEQNDGRPEIVATSLLEFVMSH